MTKFVFKIFAIAIFVTLSSLSNGVFAQDIILQSQQKSNTSDTLTVKKSAVDSSLVGRDIINMIEEGGSVAINQSVAVEQAFPEYLKRNGEKKISGYRIRIFFDNKQTARAESEELEKAFIEQFPNYPVYRTYTNPYFKVAVGDFRSKSDAVKVLETIKQEYPKAFVIKDVINYPL